MINQGPPAGSTPAGGPFSFLLSSKVTECRTQAYCASKSLFGAPQSGHIQDSGRSSQRVPGGIPCAGSPACSS
jgi:hypothetical protein